jgi:hypothetical protein
MASTKRGMHVAMGDETMWVGYSIYGNPVFLGGYLAAVLGYPKISVLMNT